MNTTSALRDFAARILGFSRHRHYSKTKGHGEHQICVVVFCYADSLEFEDTATPPNTPVMLNTKSALRDFAARILGFNKHRHYSKIWGHGEHQIGVAVFCGADSWILKTPPLLQDKVHDEH